MLNCLSNCNRPVHDPFLGMNLPASFNLPPNIIAYSKFVKSNTTILYIELAGQFRCFPAWVALSQNPFFNGLCHKVIDDTSNVHEILTFARFHLTIGAEAEATKILLKGLKLECPVILRILARLSINKNPEAALEYAQKAVELGDLESKTLVAQLLDSDSVSYHARDGKLGIGRITIISRLIAKIDPTYATNAPLSEDIKTLRFSSFLAGITNKNSLV